MSTIPQPVWYLLTVKVSSGFMMEKRGRLLGALNPRFSHPSSLVMTQESLISLPEAARVRIVPTGRAFSGTRFLEENSQGSQS